MTEKKNDDKSAGLSSWTLTAPEMMALLRAAGVTPGAGSPLRSRMAKIEAGAEAVGGGGAAAGGAGAAPARAGKTGAPSEGQVDAIKRIARPEVVFGVMNSPPANPETSWFYGLAGDIRLARFEEMPGGAFSVVWPVRRDAITATLRGSIEPGGPVIRHGVSIGLAQNELQTFTAICDIVQEDALLAFVNRNPGMKSRFDAIELYKCYYRSANAPDLRWMAQRMRFMAPVDLAPTLEDLAAGLEALAAKDLLVKAEAGYTPSDKLGTIMALMNDCGGFGAVAKRVLSYSERGEPAWPLRHVALIAGNRSLWLLDFAETETGDFKAVLSDATLEGVDELLRTKFLAPEPPLVMPRPAPAPSPGPATVSKSACHGCGAALDPGAKFCSMCGAKTAPAECPACRAPVEPGARFCGECGKPVG